MLRVVAVRSIVRLDHEVEVADIRNINPMDSIKSDFVSKCGRDQPYIKLQTS